MQLATENKLTLLSPVSPLRLKLTSHSKKVERLSLEGSSSPHSALGTGSSDAIVPQFQIPIVGFALPGRSTVVSRIPTFMAQTTHLAMLAEA